MMGRASVGARRSSRVSNAKKRYMHLAKEFHPVMLGNAPPQLENWTESFHFSFRISRKMCCPKYVDYYPGLAMRSDT